MSFLEFAQKLAEAARAQLAKERKKQTRQENRTAR